MDIFLVSLTLSFLTCKNRKNNNLVNKAVVNLNELIGVKIWSSMYGAHRGWLTNAYRVHPSIILHQVLPQRASYKLFYSFGFCLRALGLEDGSHR